MTRLTLPDVLRHNVEHHSGRDAVCFAQRTLSWSDLAREANGLARLLVDGGVRRGDRVGILLHKSAETGIGVHGVLRAGAAYVPLNPAAPVSELAEVLRDCGIRHLVSAPKLADTVAAVLEQEGVALTQVVGLAPGELDVRTESWSDAHAAAEDSGPDPDVIGDDLAYIIYTSGSTGRPKGIMHTHESCLAFCRWACTRYGLRPEDRLTNQAPLHFDMSIFDYFAAALAGAATVVVPEAHTKMPASYAALLSQERISVFFTVPFALVQLLTRGALEKQDLSELRWIIYGGESTPTKHLRHLMELLPDVRFNNMYGPAETNGCTCYDVPPIADDEAPIPIGEAASGMECIVVDDHGAPVGIGAVGELLVRGPTLMAGYWNRPDLNEKVFHRRRRDGGREEVFYRTGDLVEVLERDGFRFVGRLDRQVKIRGYRIELEAIEHALLAHPAVEEAAAFALPDGDSRAIEAAVKVRAGRMLEPREVIAHLRSLVPPHAVPRRIELVESFPRLSSGKIDYPALSEDGDGRS